MNADRVISTAMIVAVGLLFLGWLVVQAAGEFALRREYSRPSSRMPERESCLRRVYPRPVTDVEHRATLADLDAVTRQLETVTRLLAEANDRAEQELAS